MDFSKDGTNEWDNLVQAFVTKRKSFEYENEIRAVTCLPADDNLCTESLLETANREAFLFSSSPKAHVINPKELTDKGKYVGADLQTLIERVYIASYAEPWFEEVLESLFVKIRIKFYYCYKV